MSTSRKPFEYGQRRSSVRWSRSHRTDATHVTRRSLPRLVVPLTTPHQAESSCLTRKLTTEVRQRLDEAYIRVHSYRHHSVVDLPIGLAIPSRSYRAEDT